MKKIISFVLAIALAYPTMACTNYLITKGASKDGSTMISYAADSHVLFGELYHWPAQKWPDGSMLKVYEWDTGKYLGEIKQASETYNVVGNVNEYQLAIGETTYGGRKELSDTTAIIDYGSLIYITLQRSKNAREAIKNMTDLVAEYGYYSSGESFSIADPNEAWILEMISKGPNNKGAVWVARMIPDGYVSGHANQARITTFPLKGKGTISSKNMNKIFDKNIVNVYAKDLISFAREKGYYTGKDEDFSFSDTYAPVDFGGARFCEIRVWSMFNDVADGMDKYWEYCKGNIQHAENLENGNKNVDKYATNRMPLWVKPTEKISVLDMFHFMRNHLEGTELDMSKDIGAGPFGNPYRWRGLTWQVDGKTYCNERATATQQTGFSFIAQLRSWLPREIGAINWFGVDDAASCVYMPMYASITKIPHSLAVGNGDITTWSDDAAFWVFNQVSNFAYTRYSLIHPEIEKKQSTYEKEFVEEIVNIDAEAKKLLTKDKSQAIELLTHFSNKQADSITEDWNDFYKYLFVKYSDGNIKTRAKAKEGYKFVTPKLEQPGYGEDWYKKIVKETGEQFLMPGAPPAH
jgi:dipeptidase